ncbi:hypothetical protein L3X38_026547 [Prunus dulcis]|uniref:Uncharacterized protein n=1 Tax=Prunus dulcis TaxID=3755 RepID=A0AAD4VNI7_PRUDU|nr:hypothetical protein L3X38_026547 [Prunus dulcis]
MDLFLLQGLFTPSASSPLTEPLLSSASLVIARRAFPLTVLPCLVLLLFGTSIVAPAYYGASIVAYALAGVVLLWSMLPPLMLPLLALLSIDGFIVVVALPFAFASALSTAVLTGFQFLCSA